MLSGLGEKVRLLVFYGITWERMGGQGNKGIRIGKSCGKSINYH
jgi:hypothetical protein